MYPDGLQPSYYDKPKYEYVHFMKFYSYMYEQL
jgi:hypothetical protein